MKNHSQCSTVCTVQHLKSNTMEDVKPHKRSEGTVK